VIRPGTVLYEIAGVPEAVARGAFARIAHKLPLKVRCIARRTM
jgi:large subunit ribosomal protein L16